VSGNLLEIRPADLLDTLVAHCARPSGLSTGRKPTLKVLMTLLHIRVIYVAC